MALVTMLTSAQSNTLNAFWIHHIFDIPGFLSLINFWGIRLHEARGRKS